MTACCEVWLSVWDRASLILVTDFRASPAEDCVIKTCKVLTEGLINCSGSDGSQVSLKSSQLFVLRLQNKLQTVGNGS